MIFFNRELVQDSDLAVTMVSNSTTEVHNKKDTYMQELLPYIMIF
jgi:hypothetical protein